MAGRSETHPSEKRPRVDQPLLPKISLCIKSQDGDRIFYRVARDKRIQLLLSDYCRGKALQYNTVSFLYNGNRFKPTRTPNELGMEDGDEIDAMLPQDGGGYASCQP